MFYKHTDGNHHYYLMRIQECFYGSSTYLWLWLAKFSFAYRQYIFQNMPIILKTH